MTSFFADPSGNLKYLFQVKKLKINNYVYKTYYKLI